MSTKRVAFSFEPSLEALANRITPNHHKNIPTLIPKVAEAGGAVIHIGNVVDLSRLCDGQWA
jgi:hypothetical protein